jgi:hypothetical protein
MAKIIFKFGLTLGTLTVLLILYGMSVNSESRSTSKLIVVQDSLKTEKQYSLNILKDQSVKISLGNASWFFNKNNPYFKANDTVTINTRDYQYLFNNYEFKDSTGSLNENKDITIPEELNLYNSRSTSEDIKSIMNFAINNIGETSSWWRYYSFNKKNGIDIKMMGLFHDFMKNKEAREVIYASIKQNYALLNSQITVFQKRVLIADLSNLINFCTNYSVNRKKYLNGKTSVTEKPGEYDFNAYYGYENNYEGFLFRRIEFDGIPPLEIAQFLKELQKIIVNSVKTSDYNSNMSCEFNGGKLKINSYVNAKNKTGFLIRTSNNNNFYFIPSDSIKITKLEVQGKDYWRIVYDYGNGFITLDENLNKL